MNDVERVYRTPAQEFELSCITLEPGRPYASHASRGPDSILVLEGSPVLAAPGQSLTLERGSIVLAPWNTGYVLTAPVGGALLFKASLPAS